MYINGRDAEWFFPDDDYEDAHAPRLYGNMREVNKNFCQVCDTRDVPHAWHVCERCHRLLLVRHVSRQALAAVWFGGITRR